MRKERAHARKAMSSASIRQAVDVVDQMEIDSPLATTAPSSTLPSTNPFEFPAAPGTSYNNTALHATPPSFPSFPRTSSSTPSSLIPQTASLSLAPDSRPFLFHSQSSQQDSLPLKSTSKPIDKLPIDMSDGGVSALDTADPIFAGVASMRQQRMSMVANYRQYVCVHECVLVGAMQEIEEELRKLRELSSTVSS